MRQCPARGASIILTSSPYRQHTESLRTLYVHNPYSYSGLLRDADIANKDALRVCAPDVAVRPMWAGITVDGLARDHESKLLEVANGAVGVVGGSDYLLLLLLLLLRRKRNKCQQSTETFLFSFVTVCRNDALQLPLRTFSPSSLSPSGLPRHPCPPSSWKRE